MNQFVHKMNEEDDEQLGTEEKKQGVQDEEEEIRQQMEEKDFGINKEEDN